jgi:hypothetical protein
MDVRLTTTQRNAIRWLHQDGWDEVRDWLGEAEQPWGTAQSWDCTMPAIGWKRVLQALDELVVGPRGGVRRAARSALVNARHRIAKQLATMEAHPALRGVAVPETSTVAIPAWWDGERWSIYPLTGEKMVILFPSREEWGGMMVTQWHPALPAGTGLADEAAHRVFVK